MNRCTALQHHCTPGRISLDELLQRTAQAQTAATRAELDALLGDLPADEPGPDEPRWAGLRDPALRVHATVGAAGTRAPRTTASRTPASRAATHELPTADTAPDRVGVPPRLTMLTDREREVLAFVGMACSNQEIAGA